MKRHLMRMLIGTSVLVGGLISDVGVGAAPAQHFGGHRGGHGGHRGGHGRHLCGFFFFFFFFGGHGGYRLFGRPRPSLGRPQRATGAATAVTGAATAVTGAATAAAAVTGATTTRLRAVHHRQTSTLTNTDL